MSRILFVLFLVFAFSAVGSSELDGQKLFEKRCAACHKLPNPENPPKAGWEKQLDMMAPLARLKKDQKQDVLSYILSHTRAAAMDAALDEDRTLFENKCSRCHTLDRILLSELKGDDLRHVVNRMQNRSGTDWLSDQEVERVLAYLADAPRGMEPPVRIATDSSPEQLFLARCSACHSLERIFENMKAANGEATEFWSHTVSRMRNKAPQWMSDTEAGKILAYLGSFETVDP